jgi:hypothetical protein
MKSETIQELTKEVALWEEVSAAAVEKPVDAGARDKQLDLVCVSKGFREDKCLSLVVFLSGDSPIFTV